MGYLTDKERKMPHRIKLLQIVLGLQTCKTKGEVADLLEEVQELAIQDYKKKVDGAIKRYFKHSWDDSKKTCPDCQICRFRKRIGLDDTRCISTNKVG